MEFNHIPVMLDEVINALMIKPDGVYVDGTAGGGNHSLAITQNLSEKGRLICADRDTDAIKACSEKLSNAKCFVEIIHSEFSAIPDILNEKNIKVDGILLDLGVSSHQLSKAERGFSYMVDADLDMRMDKGSAFSAKNVVNEYTKENLEKIFFEYGEERYSKKIAAAIVNARQKGEIKKSLELVDIIKSAMPPAALREKQHPAKRVFQAIRIEVNNELKQLSLILEKIVPCLNPNGRIAIISFHSLEDKIVKQAFNKFAKPCTCPDKFPICVCGKTSLGQVVGKACDPTTEEVERNPKARSAKLRIFEKI